MNLSFLASELGLEVLRDAEIKSLGKLYHDKDKLFVFLESINHLHSIGVNSHIAGVITDRELAEHIPSDMGVILSENPRLDFYAIHDYLIQNTNFYGILENTEIHPGARVSASSIIASKGVKIAEGAVIEDGAIIHEYVEIKENATIRSGAVIGAEGFEFYKKDGSLKAVYHAGGVIISRNAEVQSGTVIEKAVYGGRTLVGENSKIGSNALVAHNTVIGKSCLIAGGVTISGNVNIADQVWIGPGATISNGITLGFHSHIALGSTVARSVPMNAKVTGIFAADKHEMFKFMAKSKLIK